ncbi:MAG: LysM peptidoglycan-binding domain-containing protein [Dehalococcoidia bacterium]|nr:MAG: LysM peptidoglycan-binding domain-containing protein [Dehalococcoidia bacterium]
MSCPARSAVPTMKAPMHTSPVFRRSLHITVLAATVLVVSACGKQDPPAPPGIPTATPFAQVPDPAIVPPGTRTTGSTNSSTAAGITPTPSATSTPAPERTYTVVAGDAMSLIAQRFQTTAAAIRTLNNMATDEVRIGQVLRIPPAAVGLATPTAGPTTNAAAGGPPRPTPPAASTDSYVVKAGDTAFGIALSFQITLGELEQANGKAPGGLNNIQAGETIRVPKPR